MSQAMKIAANSERARLPVLDLGRWLQTNDVGERDKLVVQLRQALEEVGFFFIRQHSIPQWKIDAVFAEASRFFTQPTEMKAQLKLTPVNTGYMPLKSGVIKTSDLNKNDKPDLVESFFMKRERSPHDPDVINNKPYRGMNVWPGDLPGFRETMVDYMQSVDWLGKRLVPLFALAAGMPQDAMEPAFRDPQLAFRLSHYPPVPAEANQFGIAPHSDAGFMTILPPSKVAGLWIRPKGGDWMEAPVMPDAMLVNSGDILRRWTNDRFLSTPHKVVNQTGEERFSAPIFFDPNTDHLIECLPSCTSAENPPKYPTITYESYLKWFMENNYKAPVDKAVIGARP